MTARRELLAALLAALAAAGLPETLRAQPNEADVLVVGAGMAGLSAAQFLRQAGYVVIVLEARERIGGRIWTDERLGLPVDLGAAWIHGADGNPLSRLARDAGIDTVATDFEARALYRNGKRLSRATLAAAATQLEGLLTALAARQPQAATTESLATSVRALRPQVDPLTQWLLHSEIELEYGADLAALGLTAWNQDDAFGGDDLLLKQGYLPLLKTQTAGLDIRLRTPVQRISRSPEGVQIETAAGRFAARAAVISLPLGVLKADTVRFDPPLDRAKQRAIARLGVGELEKIALKFPRVFWPAAAHSLASVDAPVNQLFEFWSLLPASNAPVLVGLSGGEHSRALVRLSDESVAREAMGQLRSMIADAPDPIGVVRTRWSQDPFAGGSYSLVAPGATLADYDTLTQPQGALYFAGEATHSQYPGTVHGAHLSGLRAARQLDHDWDDA